MISGCCIPSNSFNFCKDSSLSRCTQPACGVTQLTPAEPRLLSDCGPAAVDALSPLDIQEEMLTPEQLLSMSLADCIREALATSHVLRDLGGTVIRSPQSVNSNLDPAIVFSDPRSGEEAALSSFDANLFVNNYFERNHRGLNNQFFGNNGEFKQDLNTTQTGVNKRSATGGLFSFRNVTTYDRNNQLSNRFPSILGKATLRLRRDNRCCKAREPSSLGLPGQARIQVC